MAAKTTKPKSRPRTRPGQDGDATLTEAAKAMDISELAAMVWGEAYAAPWLPTVTTQAAAAEFFGVSRRSICDWLAKGCPGGSGKYHLGLMLEWRREQPEPEPWHHTGSPDLRPRAATGDLARALLCVLREELPPATRAAGEDLESYLLTQASTPGEKAIAEKARIATLVVLAKHMDRFVLDDEQIAQLLQETWELV